MSQQSAALKVEDNWEDDEMEQAAGIGGCRHLLRTGSHVGVSSVLEASKKAWAEGRQSDALRIFSTVFATAPAALAYGVLTGELPVTIEGHDVASVAAPEGWYPGD